MIEAITHHSMPLILRRSEALLRGFDTPLLNAQLLLTHDESKQCDLLVDHTNHSLEAFASKLGKSSFLSSLAVNDGFGNRATASYLRLERFAWEHEQKIPDSVAIRAINLIDNIAQVYSPDSSAERPMYVGTMLGYFFQSSHPEVQQAVVDRLSSFRFDIASSAVYTHTESLRTIISPTAQDQMMDIARQTDTFSLQKVQDIILGIRQSYAETDRHIKEKGAYSRLALISDTLEMHQVLRELVACHKDIYGESPNTKESFRSLDRLVSQTSFPFPNHS